VRSSTFNSVAPGFLHPNEGCGDHEMGKSSCLEGATRYSIAGPAPLNRWSYWANSELFAHTANIGAHGTRTAHVGRVTSERKPRIRTMDGHLGLS
jgi:hypothetical protein